MQTHSELLRNMAGRCRSIAHTRLTEEGQSILLRMAEDYERQARAGIADEIARSTTATA